MRWFSRFKIPYMMVAPSPTSGRCSTSRTFEIHTAAGYSDSACRSGNGEFRGAQNRRGVFGEFRVSAGRDAAHGFEQPVSAVCELLDGMQPVGEAEDADK